MRWEALGLQRQSQLKQISSFKLIMWRFTVTVPDCFIRTKNAFASLQLSGKRLKMNKIEEYFYCCDLGQNKGATHRFQFFLKCLFVYYFFCKCAPHTLSTAITTLYQNIMYWCTLSTHLCNFALYLACWVTLVCICLLFNKLSCLN